MDGALRCVLCRADPPGIATAPALSSTAGCGRVCSPELRQSRQGRSFNVTLGERRADAAQVVTSAVFSKIFPQGGNAYFLHKPTALPMSRSNMRSGKIRGSTQPDIHFGTTV